MRTVYNPFPDPEHADDSGLLCMGGALDVETLYAAYTRGIFPWPHQGTPLLWFTPADRGVLDFEDLHIARSLKRFMRGTDWQLTFDQDFAAVIRACSAVPRPGQEGTWITDEMIAGYTAFHEAGFAHSVECWHGDQLIGGIYGVFVQDVFSAESMFHLQDNASKLCLLALIERLQVRGLTWLDVQMVTPTLEAFGAKEIPRDEFLERIAAAHAG